MRWLYDAVKELVLEANKLYFENENVYKMLLDKCNNRDYNIWTNVNEVGSKNNTHTYQMHGQEYIMFNLRGQVT